MAYINSQGMQDEDEQVGLVGTNIFQNTMAGGQPSSPPPGGLTAPDQSQPITPQAPGSASAGAGQARQVQGGTAGQAFKRNVGKNQSTLDADGIAGNINKSRQDYGNAADVYMAKIGNAATYTVGADDVSGALDGDFEKSEKVKKRLNQGPEPLEEFKPEINTDYASDENKFKFGGLKQNYREQGGPMGTRGEAVFDASLLQQDVGFQQDRAQVRQANQDLKNVVKEKDDFRGLNAQKNYQAAWDQGSTDSRSLVQKAIDDIIANAEGERVKAQKLRDDTQSPYMGSGGTVAQLPPEIRREVDAILNEYTDDEYASHGFDGSLGDNREGEFRRQQVQAMMQSPNFDWSKFVQFGGAYDRDEFLTDADAQKANRGSELLGKADRFAAKAPTSSQHYALNGSAMQQAIQNMLKTTIGIPATPPTVDADSIAATPMPGPEVISGNQNEAPWPTNLPTTGEISDAALAPGSHIKNEGTRLKKKLFG